MYEKRKGIRIKRKMIKLTEGYRLQGKGMAYKVKVEEVMKEGKCEQELKGDEIKNKGANEKGKREDDRGY